MYFVIMQGMQMKAKATESVIYVLIVMHFKKVAS